MFYVIWSLPFILAVWYTICLVIARVGGWHSLARHYRASATPAGKRLRMQSARVGWVDYSLCLNICVAEEGLHIAVWPIIGVGHPPLLIPWSAIRVLSVDDRWWRKDVTLSIGSPEIGRIRLPMQIVDAAQHLQSSMAAGKEEPGVQAGQGEVSTSA